MVLLYLNAQYLLLNLRHLLGRFRFKNKPLA